jgi:hypothetical protein
VWEWPEKNHEEDFDHFGADDDCDYGSAGNYLSVGGHGIGTIVFQGQS